MAGTASPLNGSYAYDATATEVALTTFLTDLFPDIHFQRTSEADLPAKRVFAATREPSVGHPAKMHPENTPPLHTSEQKSCKWD
jgi:hypothetical protein